MEQEKKVPQGSFPWTLERWWHALKIPRTGAFKSKNSETTLEAPWTYWKIDEQNYVFCKDLLPVPIKEKTTVSMP